MSDNQVQRIPGNRGLRGESHAPASLKLHNLRLPKATASVLPPKVADVSGGLSNWGMLGNGPDPGNLPCYSPNGCGDCGPAMTEHARMSKAAVNGTFPSTFRPPHTAYTQEIYIGYQHSMGETGTCPDNGVYNLSWLTWLYQQTKTHPGYDEFAFAEVDFTNVPSGWTQADVIHRAMVDFRGVLVGIILPPDYAGQFMRAEPWSVSATNQPDPSLAHDVFLGAYGAEPEGAKKSGFTYQLVDHADDWFATWGVWQPATVAWETACITDAWVILTKEDAERAGYDYQQAITAIESMLNGNA